MEPQPGLVIGEKYRLDAEIGRGGMGSVWRGTHLVLERPIAIKFLESGGSAERRAERFLREAKIAAGIRHSHVVDIVDYGVIGGTQPYIVMELLDGRSLGDRFESGEAMEDAAFLDTIARVLAGLAAVHDAGVVHRDIKPDNIFLVDDGDGSVYPKIVDFGISRGNEAEQSSSGKITATGALVGTPQYMSPEQARGLRDLDGRSDLFSVGVMLYEGLAGTPPFVSEHPGDMLIMIATQDAPSLEMRRPDLPDAVHAVVDRALARDRAHRFASARDMRRALLDALAVLDPSSRREPTGTVRHPTRSTSELVPSARSGPASVSIDGLPSSRGRGRIGLVVASLALVAATAAAVLAFTDVASSENPDTGAPEAPTASAARGAIGVPTTVTAADDTAAAQDTVSAAADPRDAGLDVVRGADLPGVARDAIAPTEADVAPRDRATDPPAADSEHRTSTAARRASRARRARRASSAAQPPAAAERPAAAAPRDALRSLDY